MNSNAHNGIRFNYLFGLINLAAVFCIVWLLWYVFMNPNAVMRLYDPMYGLSLILVFLASIVLMINVADYYPFQAKGSNVITRGIILVVVSILLTLFIYYIIFWNFIGRLGVAYFSPQSIVASGGIGAEPYNARMNASMGHPLFFHELPVVGCVLESWLWAMALDRCEPWGPGLVQVFCCHVLYGY